ncbi:MAG: hypothetical protein JWO46_857 [Nocardioidaceae bacterium]|nr:hypothetical protein [Nocardioidaceae bacterium]
MSRGRRSLAALAVIALITTGCSKAPAETGNGSSTTHDKAMKFAACMRDNGISAFPDPDASGALTVDEIANGSAVDTSSPAWTKALAACKDLEPAGFTGRARSAEQQEYALKFAQCIRDNGVKDFPDPTRDGPLVDTNRIPSTAGSGGMSTLDAAMKKCGAVYADKLGLGHQ